MRKLVAGVLLVGSLLFGSPRKTEAQAGAPYVSPSHYFERELNYGHKQHPYYTAVTPGFDGGMNWPVMEVTLLMDEYLDLGLPRPYSYVSAKYAMDKAPICGEMDVYFGDYLDDMVPFWGLGVHSHTKSGNFHWQALAEGRLHQLKGVKAYTTTILKRAAGGQYFMDVHPGVGRMMVADSGKPTLTRDMTWDLYANAGFTGKKGNTFALSVDFDEGKFRNASAGWGKRGIDVRLGIDSKRHVIPSFNYRNVILKSGKKRR